MTVTLMLVALGWCGSAVVAREEEGRMVSLSLPLLGLTKAAWRPLVA
jgi:hypothetical protein